jgi:transposase
LSCPKIGLHKCRLMNKEKQSFSEHVKRSIIEEVGCGAISKEAARRRYGIKGKSSILKWQRNYEKYGRCSLNLLTDPMPLKQKPNRSDQSNEELRARIKQLERQLGDEQLRSEAYSRMIDAAETELKVPIRKKSSTK